MHWVINARRNVAPQFEDPPLKRDTDERGKRDNDRIFESVEKGEGHLNFVALLHVPRRYANEI